MVIKAGKYHLGIPGHIIRNHSLTLIITITQATLLVILEAE
jgi:hypothetical protein